jgi:hypothetical protein
MPLPGIRPNAGHAFSCTESEPSDADVVAAGMQTTVVPVSFRQDDVTIAGGFAHP